MPASFTLTGRHVLAIIAGFFLTVVAANAIFITLAVRSFPGEQEKKSYLQGLAFNERIAEREAQASLGWTAEIARAQIAGDRAEIEVRFLSAISEPIAGLDVAGILARRVNDENDFSLAFEETEPGLYRAIAQGAEPGAWRLVATATSDRGEAFRLEKRMTLE